MARATRADLARRINAARVLLMKLGSMADAARAVSKRHRVSEMQAYRYLRQARETKHALPIPERKEVFTVKLPTGLVQRLRRLAKATGATLSAMATQALESFLARHG